MQTFQQLGLSAAILKALSDKGFEKPTQIQEQAIPAVLKEPKDLIGLAQTGTGKTAAFCLPLLDLIDPDIKETQAVIIAPTRELAQQIATELDTFSTHLPEISKTIVYGGTAISNQIRTIKKRAPQILVATPGRLIDLIDRKVVKLHATDFVILDEADEMLNMGFKEDIDRILKETPESKLTWLFSATMPAEIKKLTKKYMSNPIEVSVDQQIKVNDNIAHQYMLVKHQDKREALKRFLDVTPEAYAVVFCRTKRETQLLADQLIEGGYNAEALHGDLSQEKRDTVMNRFRKKTCQVLVCTDVAARGIDVDDLTHVVHISLPDDRSYYTHRAGRTARGGKLGVSIAILSGDELTYKNSLERQLKIKMEKVPVPSSESIAQSRLQQWVNQVYTQKPIKDEAINTALIEAFEDLSKEDIIKHVAAMAVDRFNLNGSKRDLNIDESSIRNKGGSSPRGRKGGGGRNDRRSDRGGRSERPQRGSGGGGAGARKMADSDKVFINVGSQDGLNVPDLLHAIHKKTGLSQRQIGDIRLRRNHALVEVPSKKTTGFIKDFSGSKLNGRDVVAKKDGKKD